MLGRDGVLVLILRFRVRRVSILGRVAEAARGGSERGGGVNTGGLVLVLDGGERVCEARRGDDGAGDMRPAGDTRPVLPLPGDEPVDFGRNLGSDDCFLVTNVLLMLLGLRRAAISGWTVSISTLKLGSSTST